MNGELTVKTKARKVDGAWGYVSVSRRADENGTVMVVTRDEPRCPAVSMFLAEWFFSA